MNELARRKERLLTVEKSLKSFIETDSSELEAELKKYLQTGAIVGGVLLGYTVYKILENKDIKKKGEATQPSRSKRPFSSFKHRIGAVILTLLYKEFTKRLKEGKKEVEKSLSGKSKTS